MALRLPRFTPGRPITEEVTAEKLNQIVEAVRQCELAPGVGYDINRGPAGSTLTIRGQTTLSAGGGAAVQIIGPTNSGISHTNAAEILDPGTASYNFESRTPSGEYIPASVHGMYFGTKIRSNTNPSLGAFTEDIRFHAEQTGLGLSDEDTFRNIGLLVSHQGAISEATAAATSQYASTCDAITSGNYVSSNRIVNCGEGTYLGGSSRTGSLYGTTASGGTLCSGVRYIVTTTCQGMSSTQYYTFTEPEFASTAAGSFVIDNPGATDDQYVGTEALLPTGVYFFRRTFLVPESSASAGVSIRIRVRPKTVGTWGRSTFHSVRVNGTNVGYTYFETPSSGLQPLEISEGFKAGSNTLEIGVTSSDNVSYPTVSFEFLPTTAVIAALDSDDQVGDFIDLTEEQMDLISEGTPVKALSGVTAYIWSYRGEGPKNASDSYDQIRQA